MNADAFTATAVDRLNKGDSAEQVRDAFGLSESELAEALKHSGQGASAPNAGTDDPQTAHPAPAGLADRDWTEVLLAWAEEHPTVAIRNKAARIRGDLGKLAARREAEDAQRQAEERVTQLKAELDQAQERLRTLKAGSRPAVPAAATTPAGRKRGKEELAKIRAWARAKGYQVADAGIIRKAVIDAYDAAHPTISSAGAL